ncbi:hypothetical protein Tco_0842001 [Tanacetum coccineum]|uniref:Reverse transcriptase domain-containing protein n=1 Tax=Tanacetum coccineum TaxID=301880 RepID=A0ABQ5B3M2_9ASTR
MLKMSFSILKNEIMEQMRSICDMVGQYMQKKEEDKRIAEDQAVKDRYWKIHICYDDDDDEESSIPLRDIIISELPPCIAITPVLFTEEPVDSLIIEDEHLNTISATESDEVIKSSVENLVPIPSESEGISDSMCDVLLSNNPTPLEAKDHSEIVVDSNDDYSSSDDDSPYDEDIDYVDASPPDSELFSLEVVEIVIPEVGGIDTDILLTIKDDFLHENLLNVNLLIVKIEALKDNPTPSFNFIDFLLEEFAGELALIAPIPPGIVEADFDPKGDIRFIENLMYDNSFLALQVVEIVIPEVGRIDTDILLTIKDDILHEKLLNVNLLIVKIEALKRLFPLFSIYLTSLPKVVLASQARPKNYEAFFCDSELDSGNFTMDVVEDIFDNPTREPRVHVPKVLPTHPTLQLDSDFTLSSDSLGSDLVVSFPSGTRNKIFDPRIFIEVQSKRFLSPNEFSISFICDPLSPVFDTLLPFSFENEDNVFNPGILASNEEKSLHLLSHWGFKAF